MQIKKSNKYIIALGIFIGLYIVATLSIPADPATLAKYSLTENQGRLLSFTIMLPFILIWMVAFYGALRFKQYTESIKQSDDGRMLNRMADGHIVLAFSLPITTLAGSFLSYISVRSPDLVPEAVIIRNYLSIILSITAFALIGEGAKGLASLIKKKTAIPYKYLLLIGFVVLATTYIYLIFNNPSRQFAEGDTQRAAYYLPDWLIAISIILPYLYVWYLGIRSTTNINIYRKGVSGRIYKPFLGSLVTGLGCVVFSSVLFQFLVAASDSLAHLDLKPLLLLVYVLLISIAAGYIIIARAIQRLRKIEEA